MPSCGVKLRYGERKTFRDAKAQSSAAIAIIAMSRGQTPRHRHDGPHRIGWGLSQVKRRGGCRADSCGHAATREAPGIHEASEPWRVALQAGPGAFTPSGRADEPQRWQARRAETGLAAAVGHRHAAAAALDGKRKGVKGTLAALAAAPPVSHQRGDGSPISTQLPHARPGVAVTRPRGAVDTCLAPPRAGGANPVVARSVTRRTRPSRSSAPGAGRTGRCAGRRPRPGRS